MWHVGGHVVQIMLAVCTAASIAFYGVGVYGAWDFFRRQRHPRRVARPAAAPGVSILKPLKGLEADLAQNLGTYCCLDYPNYQIVFGVRDADDPAIEVVLQLRRDYPQARIDLVIDGRVYGTNYKVSNLYNMYAAAVHDVIVIADSDIRVPTDYLQRVVPLLEDPKVGVVSCLYRAARDGGLPTLLESLFINTDFAPMVLVARVVETPTYAFGATMAMRRATLEEIGGFLPLANLLADDYYIGQRVVARGYRSALSDLVVETVPGTQSWRRVLDHQLRWARTYRNCRPGGYFFSIITHGTLWATSSLLYYHFSPLACLLAATVYGARIAASTFTNRYLGAPTTWREALLIPVKDLFVSAVWALSYFGDTVSWSGNRFRVLHDGQMLLVSVGVPGETDVPAFPVPTERGQRAA